MSSPSSSTRPVIQPPSTSSCIRLSVRRKVDLPQPDGPISAWTRLARKPTDTLFTAVNLPYIAVSLSVSTRTAVSGAAAAGLGGATRRAASAIEREPPADGEARPHAQQEDHEYQDQGRRPRVAVPFLERAGGIGEDGEGQ